MAVKKDGSVEPIAQATAESTPKAVATPVVEAKKATGAAMAVEEPAKVTAAAPAAPVAAAPAAAKVEAARDRSTVVALIVKLRHQDADVARDAATTLGGLPADAEAVKALCEAVRNHDGYYHAVVRAAAATALGKFGEVKAVDALIEGTRDAMAAASEEAVKALGLLKDPRALPALEAVVKNESGFFLEHVRATAREAVQRVTQQGKAKT